MAIGDQTDMLARLRNALPAGWFPTDAPVLDAALSAPAEMWSWVHGLIEYARLQARISTATGNWLDMAAADYFRDGMPRLTNEGDTAYRARILAGLLPERATRAAVIAVVTALTGRAPVVFEPAHTGDTGGYGDGTATWRGMAYGAVGGWGSLTHPFQAFITAYRPRNGGVATVGGFSVLVGNLSAWQSNGDSVVTLDTPLISRMIPSQPVSRGVMLTAGPTTNKAAGYVVTSCTAGVTYEVSVWVLLPVSTTATAVTVKAEAGAASQVSAIGAATGTTGSWQRISSQFVASGGTTNLVIRVDYTGAQTVYFTGLRIDAAPSPFAVPGGYGVGAIQYISRDMIDGQVTDDAIFQAIEMAAPAGSIMWTKIEA